MFFRDEPEHIQLSLLVFFGCFVILVGTAFNIYNMLHIREVGAKRTLIIAGATIVGALLTMYLRKQALKAINDFNKEN